MLNVRSAPFRLAGLAVLAAVLLLALLAARGWSSDSPNRGGVWFEDLREPIDLSSADSHELMRSVADAATGRQPPNAGIRGGIESDSLPRIVFLSVSNGATRGHVLIGSGRGLSEAIGNALAEVQALRDIGYRPVWVKLDIVQETSQVPALDLNQPWRWERSLQGMAFDRDSAIAFLPEELVAHTLVDSKQMIRRPNIAEYLANDGPKLDAFRRLEGSNRVSAHTFKTASFFSDGHDVVSLYRGHRVAPGTSRDELLAAARSGGEYLTREVSPTGKFTYIYYPKENTVPKQYNLIRHAGTLWSMLELYEVIRDEELLAAARRATAYLLRFVKPCQAGAAEGACVVDGDQVALGGNALSAVALAKYIELTGERQYMPTLLGLGRWIQSVQKDDGEFPVHRQAYPDGQALDGRVPYFPGESMLAMLRIYRLDPDRSWLVTAEKGADHLINVRDGGVPISKLPHDHWLMYALNELYRHTPNPAYVEHTSRIAQAIVEAQHRNPRYPDWVGGYGVPPRSTPVATRSEALFAAYQLLRDTGREDQAQQVLEAIRRGVVFQLHTQFRPESVLYLGNPRRALGGFHAELSNFEIRNDYVQHNVAAILGLYLITNDSN